MLVAGLRSRAAASFELLGLVTAGRVTPVVTVPLHFEYEDVLKRPGKVPLTVARVDLFLEGFRRAAELRDWYPRPLPVLSDADDERVLRAALAAGGCPIVTHDVRHFATAGVTVQTPGEFLHEFLRARTP